MVEFKINSIKSANPKVALPQEIADQEHHVYFVERDGKLEEVITPNNTNQLMANLVKIIVLKLQVPAETEVAAIPHYWAGTEIGMNGDYNVDYEIAKQKRSHNGRLSRK